MAKLSKQTTVQFNIFEPNDKTLGKAQITLTVIGEDTLDLIPTIDSLVNSITGTSGIVTKPVSYTGERREIGEPYNNAYPLTRSAIVNNKLVESIRKSIQASSKYNPIPAGVTTRMARAAMVAANLCYPGIFTTLDLWDYLTQVGTGEAYSSAYNFLNEFKKLGWVHESNVGPASKYLKVAMYPDFAEFVRSLMVK